MSSGFKNVLNNPDTRPISINIASLMESKFVENNPSSIKEPVSLYIALWCIALWCIRVEARPAE